MHHVIHGFFGVGALVFFAVVALIIAAVRR
jgi:hypothetical protein